MHWWARRQNYNPIRISSNVYFSALNQVSDVLLCRDTSEF
jgi:hypothetical protein